MTVENISWSIFTKECCRPRRGLDPRPGVQSDGASTEAGCMILGRNVEQDQISCRIQECQLCLSYFWRYLPLLCLTVIIHWFHVRSVSQRPFWNIFMILGTWKKCRTGPDDVLHTRMTTLPFLLLVLSPFVIFYSDYPFILCPVCKSKTLWNIFMILGSNVEQDQMMCCIQEWQLAFLLLELSLFVLFEIDFSSAL